MGDRTWKAAERAVARRLGGRRVGCTGQATADVVSDWLCVEVKARKRLPAWLIEAVRQAVASSDDQRLAIVVLHQVGERHDDDLAVLRLADFQDWFGQVNGT